MRCASHLINCLRKRGVYPSTLETTYYGNQKPEYAIDYENDNSYHSSGYPNNTLTIDFKRSVTIRGYEISSCSSNNCLLNWKFEVSEDLKKWLLVDSHDDNVPPSNWGKISVSPPQNVRYIRFNGTKTFFGYAFFHAFYVKFYGELPYKCSINHVHRALFGSSFSVCSFYVLLIYS